MPKLHRLRSPQRPRCHFTVVIQCCDPPEPVHLHETDDPVQAWRQYAALVEEEIRRMGGGEFTISLWKHPDLEDGEQYPKPEVMRIPKKESDCGYGYIYNVEYPGSEELAGLSYMDLPKYLL